MFWLGCFGLSLFEQPNSAQFLAVFFQEPFVILMSLFIAWYISSFKFTPSRMEEYKCLISLPVSANNICNRFIYQDLLSCSWVAGLGIVLYLGLLPVSPISHLCRLSILTVFAFFLFVVLNTLLHFYVSLKGKNLRKYVYPNRNNPIIMVATILGYAIFQLSIIVIPSLASGYQFGIVLGLSLVGNYSLLSLAHVFFSKWQIKNLAFQMRADRTTKFMSSWCQISNPFRLFPRLNPLLLKNLVKIKREKNTVSVILMTILIMFAYLVIMNNETTEDRISVLFAVSCIYSFLFAFRSMTQFSADEESPELVYSLPLVRRDCYFSFFVPAIAWLSIVMTSLAILILISGSALSLAGLFLLKSFVAASAFLLVSFKYAAASYPDMKKAQKKFSYWMIALIILTAAFYKYRILIVSLMIILPFFQLRNVRFYRIE